MHDQTKRPVAGCGTLHGDLTRAMLLKPAPLTDAWGPYGPAQSMFRRVADVVFHDHGVPFDEDAYRRAFRTARNIVLTARREDPITVEIEEAVAAFHVEAAIVSLRCARDRLVKAGAPRAADKVRRALKSAEGALRHAQRRAPVGEEDAS